MSTYTREGDEAVMVEVAPHIFVNEASAITLELIRPAPKQRKGRGKAKQAA